MKIENLAEYIINFILEKNISKITFSNFRDTNDLKKILVSLVQIKKIFMFSLNIVSQELLNTKIFL